MKKYKKLHTQYILLCLFSLVFCICFSQTNESVSEKFKQLESDYYSKKIHDTVYLNKVSDLALTLLTNGVHIQTREMQQYLDLYKNIAFSNNINTPYYRTNYYNILMNNTNLFDKDGEAMYFAEKLKKEYQLQGKPSLVDAAVKIRIFSVRKNHKKIIETYEKEKELIHSLPDLIEKNEIDPHIGIEAFYILSPLSSVYSTLGDTLNLNEIYDLSEKLVEKLRPKITHPNNRLYIDLHILEQQFFKAVFLEDYPACSVILNEVAKLSSKHPDSGNKDMVEMILNEWKTDFYIRAKNTDSATFYLKRLDAKLQHTNNIKERILFYKGEVEFLKENYKQAYHYVKEANILNDSLSSDIMTEMDGLLHSYMKAEETHNELLVVEKEKQNQLLIIYGMCLAFIFGIYIFFTLRKRKNKIIQDKITRLNNIANIQIATIEEMAFQAVKKEQQRLGQDLHDSASSQLVAVKHQLDLLLSERTDEKTTAQLLNIQKNIETVYITTRNKSHEWLALPDGKDEIIFSKQIETNLELIFPSPRINKTVEIDEGALQEMNSEQKIELLKIIQEAITNIIKHAKPKNILLFLYKENNDSFSLIIKNDGISSSKIKQDGAGISSIISRVTKMGGNVNINTQDQFEIYINIPS